MRTLIAFLTCSTLLMAHVEQAVLEAFEKKCMICHDSFKQNEMAPPVIAIQQMYKRTYKENPEVAKHHMTDFIMKPTHDKALMKPAIKLYGLMPDQGIGLKEAQGFAEAILETVMDIPEWFEEHYKSHKFGMEHEEKPH